MSLQKPWFYKNLFFLVEEVVCFRGDACCLCFKYFKLHFNIKVSSVFFSVLQQKVPRDSDLQGMLLNMIKTLFSFSFSFELKISSTEYWTTHVLTRIVSQIGFMSNRLKNDFLGQNLLYSNYSITTTLDKFLSSLIAS